MTAQKGRTYDSTAPVAPSFEKALASGAVPHMAIRDLPDCEALHETVHGYPRTNELRDSLASGTSIAAFKDGHLRAYASMPTNWLANHSVAASEEAMRALLLGAGEMTKKPLSFLLPVRQAALFRWCLSQGFRSSREQ